MNNPLKRTAVAVVIAGVLGTVGIGASADEPVTNISSARHGNLAAAQQLVREAFDRVSAAQADNHDALGGHAARAKELMRQANDEIKLAAIVANGGVAPPAPVTVAPPGVAYVAPAYAAPGPRWVWAYHPAHGWGWYHPSWGWHRGWY